METDVVVIGGGLNGPLLALALAQGGLRVVVVDAQASGARAAQGFDGRAYALAQASKRMLAALGIWPELQARSQPITQIRASDGRAGEGAAPFFLTFDSAEIEEGPMGYMVEDRFLYQALITAMAQEARITLLQGARVVAHITDAGQARVTLADGQEIRADLLVGCDGRSSATAQRAGIRRLGHDYGQTALVTAIRHEKPHLGVAQQFFMPAGPLAILPLPGGNLSSIVWSESAPMAAAISAMDDAEFLEILRPRFGEHLGQIELAGTRFSYPLHLSLAETYISTRLALVGDAAHGVHPVAGQGLNLGLRDVAALAQVVIEARRRGDDIGAGVTLESYQLWRRFDATSLALGMDAVTRLFSNDNPLLRLGRDLGLGLLNAAAPLRRRMIRQAAGLEGALPRLLKGEKI